MQKHAALYCRLSVDDGSFGGSVSIETQKILLEQYCQAHGITEYEFYCDDGYSGTNFNRPAFQRMLSDIHAGNINLVIVKDLSRFGRNYVEVGLQVEHFKEQNVRFIAADDHYDSTSLIHRGGFSLYTSGNDCLTHREQLTFHNTKVKYINKFIFTQIAARQLISDASF